MFINDQCDVEMSREYFFAVWKECDKFACMTWERDVHLSFIKAYGAH